jgi:hypothetical protein
MEALEAPEEEVMEEEVMNRKPMCGLRILLPGMKRERTVSKERRKMQRVLMLGFCRVATANGAFLKRPATAEWTVWPLQGGKEFLEKGWEEAAFKSQSRVEVVGKSLWKEEGMEGATVVARAVHLVVGRRTEAVKKVWTGEELPSLLPDVEGATARTETMSAVWLPTKIDQASLRRCDERHPAALEVREMVGFGESAMVNAEMRSNFQGEQVKREG